MLRSKLALSCSLLVLLSGCWHKPFHTSIQNGTAQPIDLTIHFKDPSHPVGHGSIEPGNRVNLTEEAAEISYIEYAAGERRCRLDASLISKVGRLGDRGITSVSLKQCRMTSI